MLNLTQKYKIKILFTENVSKMRYPFLLLIKLTQLNNMYS